MEWNFRLSLVRSTTLPNNSRGNYKNFPGLSLHQAVVQRRKRSNFRIGPKLGVPVKTPVWGWFGPGNSMTAQISQIGNIVSNGPPEDF